MASLITPQVMVVWGDINLSQYPLKGSQTMEPIVYNVEVTCGSENQWPTGSLMWNPTGPAFDIYEKLIKEADEKTIIKVRFGYWPYNGPQITFNFNYSGTEITYGKDMSIRVSLACRQAWYSSATRNSMSIDQTSGKFDDKGKDATETLAAINGGYSGNIKVQFTDCALRDAKEVKIAQAQFKDQTYGAVTNNLMKELGNKAFLSNIGSEGEVWAYPPLSWQGAKNCGTINTPPAALAEPIPKERYGYIIGPGIITSFTRQMEYTQPSQDNVGTSGNNKNPPQSKKGKAATGTQKRPATEAEKNAQKPGDSVMNASSPGNVRGLLYTENPNGPEKQKVMNEEEGVKINAQIYMCPAVTGIKPQDVIYVPSLKGTVIEDYKVTSVTYSEQGGVISVSVQGCRPYGLNKPMYPKEAEKFLTKAKSLKTLTDWENFAWRERLGLPPQKTLSAEIAAN